MTEFEDIESLKNGSDKNEKLKNYYKDKVKIDDWLTNNSSTSIINFKDRIEYKKHDLYHRLNGPAIDFNDDKKDQYYYAGKKFDTKEDWKKATIKVLRKIKIKKLNKEEKSQD